MRSLGLFCFLAWLTSATGILPTEVAFEYLNEGNWLSGQNIRQHTYFYLYTRRNFLYPQEIRPEIGALLKHSHYNSQKNTTVIIHGFLVDSFSHGILALKKKLLDHADINVIEVDYGELMDFWWYRICPPCGMIFAVLQAPLIGSYVGRMIQSLTDAGQSLDSIHIVGHSLGAHIAGFAGKYMTLIEKTIGRITGLDPSSPGFVNVDGSLRLAPYDADFTDCIFTTAKSISVRTPICKSNFYPNGCGNAQPGCADNDFYSYFTCSHGRSVDLFIESIDPEVKFRTRRCDRMPCIDSRPYATCWSTNETLMGYWANPSVGGIFYTRTNSTPPYALNYS